MKLKILIQMTNLTKKERDYLLSRLNKGTGEPWCEETKHIQEKVHQATGRVILKVTGEYDLSTGDTKRVWEIKP